MCSRRLPMINLYDIKPVGVVGRENPLIDYLFELKSSIRGKKVCLMTNSRKFFLTRIYEQLRLEMGSEKGITREVNTVKSGFLTNPMNDDYLEPEHMILVLTKNHNRREKLVLKEIIDSKTPCTLILLGTYQSVAGNVVRIPDVKTLYHFMYNLKLTTGEIPMNQFLNLFILNA